MTDSGSAARGEIRASVARLTAGPGSAAGDPLAVLAAVVSLRAALAGEERHAARRAREDGKTWGEIGAALGITGSRLAAAERAFARLASDLGDGPVFATGGRGWAGRWTRSGATGTGAPGSLAWWQHGTHAGTMTARKGSGDDAVARVGQPDRRG